MEIEQWYAQGLVTPEQRTALRRRYDVVVNQKTKEADYSARVSAFETGAAYASPSENEDKKAVNWAVDQDPNKAADPTVSEQQENKLRFETETLEPRILLSATWVCTHNGDELTQAEEGQDIGTDAAANAMTESAIEEAHRAVHSLVTETAG